MAEQIPGPIRPLHIYLAGPPFASILYALGQREATHDGPAERSTAAGARPWCSPSPTPVPTSAPAAPKAIPQPDGSWHIEGVKRFITSADQDLTENILHLVLARPVGAGPGTKGLSLFVVPKFLFDAETGELGRPQRRLT